MIQLANEHTRPLVREIWKQVFGDEEAYMDLYFAQKYQDDNTLVGIDDDKVVASLQMLPYTITFYGEKIPFYYLAGLSTLPEYRSRGWMGRMIETSHHLMAERHIPLSILVPADESLFGYYQRFGYTQTFRRGEHGFKFTLKQIWRNSADEKQAYRLFDQVYNQQDFCVQKSFSDFQTLIEEEMREGFPPKRNLWGAARVIDAHRLLNLYAKAHPQHRFRMRVRDAQFGENTFLVENGRADTVSEHSPAPDFSLDEQLLARLLFGFDTSSLDEPLRFLFPQRDPQMNYMLE